ncbi:HAUS8 protein, partial [Turnix velox]|nr:HAUS8 protein [Turnix velox]
LESQALLLTYLRLKAEKSVAELEKKAEENLIALCRRKERLQEKLYKLKRKVLLQEREQKLEEALDKQVEVLAPLLPACEQFKEQYKVFAASLDACRCELPIKNIYIEGDKHIFLDNLQKELSITQELLAEIMPSDAEETAKASGVLQELEEVAQELGEDLQRRFTEVQNLSFEANKEVSLHNQRLCEEKHGLDVVKKWYFE